MKMKFRKNWWMWLIVGVLCCAMLGGIIYAIVASTDNKEKTIEISASEFSLGGLDDNGKYVETKESIYTKNAFQCQGLKVTPEFESQVTYQIFFYDELGEFVSKTASLEKTYTDDIPGGSSFARVVITPNKDNDGNAIKMNVFNKSKYAKQLTITVNKEQKTFIEQLESLDNQAVYFGTGMYTTSSGLLESNSTTPFYFFSPVDVSSAKIAYVKLKTESLTSKVTYAGNEMDSTSYYPANNQLTALHTCPVVAERNGYSYVSIDVSDMNQFVMYTDELSSQVLEIYLI